MVRAPGTYVYRLAGWSVTELNAHLFSDVLLALARLSDEALEQATLQVSDKFGPKVEVEDRKYTPLEQQARGFIRERRLTRSHIDRLRRAAMRK